MVEVADRPTRADRVATVEELVCELGRPLLRREIAERLGVSLSYASSLVGDPDGSKDRERKKRYGGVCEACGGPTDGSSGRAKAPKVCMSCLMGDPDRPRPIVRPRKIWNEQRCENAIVGWIWEHRRIPRTVDFTRADPPRRPCLQTIMRYCYRYTEREVKWHGSDGEVRTAIRRECVRAMPDVLVDLVGRLPVDAVVAGSSNATIRARLFEVLGIETIVRDHGQKVSTDDYGTLWRLERQEWREAVVMVQVLNSTPEPDGSFKDYFLRVPPDVASPREAIAWTFQTEPDAYELAVET